MKTRSTHKGSALIEAMISVVIAAFGMLGYLGLQARTAVTNLEGYQRSQALVLVSDIAQRINLNRANAAGYVVANVGVADPGTCPAEPVIERDLCEWGQLIRGSAEQVGGSKLGAVTAARGCIEALGDSTYRISLVWSGFQATGPTPLACGRNQYTDENLRRGASVIVRIGILA